MITFFNTLHRKKEEFLPIKKEEVTIYSCGPTVYNFAHIGNLSSYIFVDVLKRYLGVLGFHVKHVMNITDVDDKTIQGAVDAHKSLADFTQYYEKEFFRDLTRLNILPPDITPRATQNISDIIAFIELLIKKGHAYEQDGSVYFKISTFPQYGQLSHLNVAGMKTGASGIDVDEYEKENVRDFVLWKKWKPQDGEVGWESPFGRGRPGWHIECSVMSTKYLGAQFDIHTGGADLIFPHHENEIAQSESATGKIPARFWLYKEFLLVNDEKMSKSLGNIKTLHDMAPTVLDAMAFRYLIAASHYRSRINFTTQAFEMARNTVEGLRIFREKLEHLENNLTCNNLMDESIKLAREKIFVALDNDLDTPQAVAAMFEFVHATEALLTKKSLCSKEARQAAGFIDEIDKIFGVLEPLRKKTDVLQEKIKGLVTEREKVRQQKDWSRSDELREEILRQGAVVEDTPSGVTWYYREADK